MFKKQTKSFVLTVGDEGAILVCMDKGKMVDRKFITSPSSPEYRNALVAFPKAPIYMLVDVIDQAYIQQNLPPVSSMNAKAIVKRKLEKDFDTNDLNTSMLLGRIGKGEWQYLFISVRNAPPLSDWIDAISELPNPFKGIYLLPIETGSLIKDLKNALSVDKRKQGSKWQIFVSHNRVGGFRQIVYKDSNVVFTRIAQSLGGLANEVIAGNIEQETLNTIEYIRRLGYTETDGLDIFIVSSAEVKQMLEVTSFPAELPIIITPYEIASHLHMNGAAEQKDKYADVITAIYFLLRGKKSIRLSTKYMDKVAQLANYRTAFRAAAVAACVAVLAYAGFAMLNAPSVSSDIATTENQIKDKTAELDKHKETEKSFAAAPEIITETVNVHKDIDKVDTKFFDYLTKFSSARSPAFSTQTIKIERKEDNPNIPSNAEFTLELMFKTKDVTQTALLEGVDQFKTSLKDIYKDYDVTFSGLPETEVNVAIDSQQASEIFKDDIKAVVNIKPSDTKAKTP